MKLILTIFCGLMALFAGGCTLVFANAAGGILLIVALVIAGLNLAVIAALWGFGKPARWVFIALAILDAIVVANVLVFWAMAGWGDSSFNVFALLTALAFAVKGILTAAVLRDLKAPSGTQIGGSK